MSSDKNKPYDIFDFELTAIKPIIQNFRYSKKEVTDNLGEYTTTDIFHDIKVNPKQKGYVVMFGIQMKENLTNITLIDVHYALHFNLRDGIKYDKKRIELFDVRLGANLIGVSYSTFRGVFSVISSSTPYSNILPLPLINPLKLLRQKSINKKNDEEDVEKTNNQ